MIIDQGWRTKGRSGTNAVGLPKRINSKVVFTARVEYVPIVESWINQLTSKLAGRDVNVPRVEVYVYKTTLYIILY